MVRVKITKDISTGPSQEGAPFHEAVNATAGQTIDVEQRTANWLVQSGYASNVEGGTTGEVKATTAAEDAAQRTGDGQETDKSSPDGAGNLSDAAKSAQGGSKPTGDSGTRRKA